MTLTFAQYTIGAFAFFGSFLYVFFFGTGLVAIPFEHMIAWADRPRSMNESQFKKEKDRLTKTVEFMIGQGRKLHDEKVALETKRHDRKEIGLFAYWSQKRTNARKQHEFEANCILVEKDFDNLRKISQYREKVEPLKYTFHFLFGGISVILFFIVFVQLWVAGTLRMN